MFMAQLAFAKRSKFYNSQAPYTVESEATGCHTQFLTVSVGCGIGRVAPGTVLVALLFELCILGIWEQINLPTEQIAK